MFPSLVFKKQKPDCCRIHIAVPSPPSVSVRIAQDNPMEAALGREKHSLRRLSKADGSNISLAETQMQMYPEWVLRGETLLPKIFNWSVA